MLVVFGSLLLLVCFMPASVLSRSSYFDVCFAFVVWWDSVDHDFLGSLFYWFRQHACATSLWLNLTDPKFMFFFDPWCCSGTILFGVVLWAQAWSSVEVVMVSIPISVCVWGAFEACSKFTHISFNICVHLDIHPVHGCRSTFISINVCVSMDWICVVNCHGACIVNCNIHGVFSYFRRLSCIWLKLNSWI